MEALQAGPRFRSVSNAAYAYAFDGGFFPSIFWSRSAAARPQPNTSQKPQAAPVLPSSHYLPASPASVINASTLPSASRKLTPPSALRHAVEQAGFGGVVAQRNEVERAHRGGEPTFTANGELAFKVDTATGDTTEYDYDALGNLKEVILPDGDLIEYRVDGANRRVAKLKNGIQERQWLWRSKLQPSAEFDGSGALRARFVYAGDRNVPSLIVTPAASYRLITDHLGSVRKVVDVATGVVAQELSYDAWGRVLMDTNPGLQPFGFAGGLYDAETELVRFGARDYDAETGRWTAKDPIRFDGGINLYEYAGSSPIVLVDPTGRIGWAAPLGWVFTLGGGGGALAGAAAVGATASLVAIGLTSVAVGNTLGDDDCDGACSPTTPL